MTGLFRKDKSDAIDEPIDKVLNELKEYDPESEEFATQLSFLERLTKIKNVERRDRVSPDTIAIVAGNLLGILIIVMYEQKHVMTSKAFGFGIKKNS